MAEVPDQAQALAQRHLGCHLALIPVPTVNLSQNDLLAQFQVLDWYLRWRAELDALKYLCRNRLVSVREYIGQVFWCAEGLMQLFSSRIRRKVSEKWV